MVKDILSGVALPFCLLLSGLYFTWKVGRYFLLHPRIAVKGMLTAGGSGGTPPARALAVALAGTLGVGNIAGVATALALGGAGAVFWMWAAAFLAMPLKYAEIVLAQRYKEYDQSGRPHGGAMYYIKVAFGKKAGRGLALLFAVLCVLCALTLGTMMQANAAAEALFGVFDVPPLAVGGIMALLAVLVLSHGAKRVESVCATLVPFVCLLFCVLAFSVLWLRRAALPAAFARIFTEALTWESGAGGVMGALTSGAVRYGVSRGLVSNEAGCGTAPIAHAAAHAQTPAQQGFWGIFEVFVDTVLLCTLTALVILVSGVTVSGGGVFSAINAFGTVLGDVAPPFVAVSVAFFAFATVLCWSHYGAEALWYLTKSHHARYVFLLAVAAAVLVGAVTSPDIVWNITDAVLALMTLLNVMVLLLLRRVVYAETKYFFSKNKTKKEKGDC